MEARQLQVLKWKPLSALPLTTHIVWTGLTFISNLNYFSDHRHQSDPFPSWQHVGDQVIGLSHFPHSLVRLWLMAFHNNLSTGRCVYVKVCVCYVSSSCLNHCLCVCVFVFFFQKKASLSFKLTPLCGCIQFMNNSDAWFHNRSGGGGRGASRP